MEIRGSKQTSPVLRRTRGEASAREILEVVPRVMWFLRREMRKGAGEGLSVPQLRILAFVERSPGASLSSVADFYGVSLPTASVMVDRLVRRVLIAREPDPRERRRVMLTLTPRGAGLLQRARKRTRAGLIGRLAGLSSAELTVLSRGLALLRSALVPAPGAGDGS